MIERLLARWDSLRSSLWFTPGILVVLAIALAWGVLRVDRWVASTELATVAWAFSGGPDSARQLLGTLSGSMMTLTGVTFSITLAALALAAGQYSPRILRNFMRDRFNQTVLGVFIGTFVYCILVLRSIRGGEDAYVPAVGVTGAIVLAMVSLGFFIVFIHHMASSIQVSSMIRAVARESHSVIAALFAREHGVVGPAWIRTDAAPVPAGFRILAHHDGYVERVDAERLCEVATEAGVELEILAGPGDFSTRNAVIAVADHAPGKPDEFGAEVRDAIFLGRQRTMAQDPAFGFRQLVDIAVRALSPGINDPTTACNAVDFLGSLLADMADRPWPSTVLSDAGGTVRLRLPPATFADYVALACTEIRRYAAADLAVTLRLLDALAVVAATTERPDRRTPLWAEARAILTGCDQHFGVPDDRKRVNDHFRRLASVLGLDARPHLLAAERARPHETTPPVRQ